MKGRRKLGRGERRGRKGGDEGRRREKERRIKGRGKVGRSERRGRKRGRGEGRRRVE